MADSTAPLHSLDCPAAARLLEVDPALGLSAAEVVSRRRKYGANQLTPRRGVPEWRKFLRQFAEPLVLVLLVATGVTLWLREWVDSSVIFAVVFANAVVGYLQESRAERAISALLQRMVAEATVRREGRKSRVSAADLVPGDIVLLEAGDRVPADVRLLREKGLMIDESALTGESVPATKHTQPLAHDTVLADRRNLAYAGTLVTGGFGEGVVWATGDRTETGRIAVLIAEAVDLSTPLTRKIAEFSRLMLWLILGLSAVTFAVGVARGEPPAAMFMAAVALAVGAIPEGLPAAVTIVLAIGVSRMARRKAVIRRLPAVEALGSTTVICSDKTGTLTENQMTVRAVWAGGKEFAVSGQGYDPAGDIRIGQETATTARHPALAECLRAGALCNESSLFLDEAGHWRVQGDPTEAALIVSAAKGGVVHADEHRDAPRLDMIPFESAHMFRATLHHHSRRGRLIYKVGALERLLERCADQLGPDGVVQPLDAAAVRAVAESMAAQGLRVLAFARRRVADDHATLRHDHVREGLTFLGLQGMIDPPRPEAVAAVRDCQAAGIAVKMITGDHAATAAAIASQIGLRGDTGADGRLRAVGGRELEAVPDADLPALAARTAIFARVAPEQKLRLVRALQAGGQVVAMTGDGVNDAPALKQADIGVAMGIAGTDVAKGAAAMVLTDDNFASIRAAVEEGRGVFDNLVKFIVWTIPTNSGEALLLVLAVFLGITLPALPVQLLWDNLTTALLLGLMLVFEPKEAGLMSRPPRDPKRPLLTLALFMRSGLVALLTTAGGFWLFHHEWKGDDHTLAQARTAVVNLIVFVEVVYLFNCRSLERFPFRRGAPRNPMALVGTALMIAAQVAFTHAPVMNRFFHTAPLGPAAWARTLAIAGLIFLVVEFEKWVRFGRGRR